jgi:hypothetical protein
MNPVIVTHLARMRELEIRRETERLNLINSTRSQSKSVEKQQTSVTAWIFRRLRSQSAGEPC